MRLVKRFALLLTTGLLSLGLPTPTAQAQVMQTSGFEVNRYQPTPAGEWSFWVDHPWYSKTRRLAAGLTLNYAHNPLVTDIIGTDGNFVTGPPIISDLLTGHFDFAISFANRVNINVSLPVTFLGSGTDTPIGGVIPPKAGLNDPRIGAMVRVYGEPDESPISVNLGLQIWAPLQGLGGEGAYTRTDAGVRVLPKVVLAGYGHSVRWSVSGGFLYRGEAILSPDGDIGNTAGSEIQFGASVQYADKEKGIAVGPEAVLATLVAPNHAFEVNHTSLELLMGAHFNIANQIQLGLAGGIGILGQSGTPDGRFLFRLAYAPIKVAPKDRDGDGVFDPEDACVDDPGMRTNDPQSNGCPIDRDQDGVVDPEDLCPDAPLGEHPDVNRRGCPLNDRDGDGIFDNEDQCPEAAMGAHPDAERKGCPLNDRDGDGVFDNEDQCPEAAVGAHPDPQRKGCPAGDRDQDGTYDPDDACPEIAAGLKPDPQRAGCPAPDRDGDSVVDHEDACPDQAGAPSADPKKSGCPGLVEVKQGRVTIKEQIFFDFKKDVILKKSFPLLLAVTDALKVSPQIKKVEVQGHTDNVGNPAFNLELSDRRAKSVMRFLVENGIAAERLSAKGYGQTRPIQDNRLFAGRAANRRVDFVILDPPQPASSAPTPVPAAPKPPVVVKKPVGAAVKAKPPLAKPQPASATKPRPPTP